MANINSVKEHFNNCIAIAERKNNTCAFVMVKRLKEAIEIINEKQTEIIRLKRIAKKKNLDISQPEIVYCKDCKYMNQYRHCDYDKPIAIWDTERMFVKSYCEDDFFCAYGERKDANKK